MRFKWQVVGGRRCERKGHPMKDWKSDSMSSQEFYFQFEGVYTHRVEQAQVGRNLLQHWRHIANLLIPSAQSLLLYRHFMERRTFQRHVICLGPIPIQKVGTFGRGYRLSQFTYSVSFLWFSRQLFLLFSLQPSVFLVYIILWYNSLHLLNGTTYAKFNDARFLNDGSERTRRLNWPTLILH